MAVQNSFNNTLLAGVKVELGDDANGDLYYWQDGVLTRLAIGTNGHLLTVVSGLPAWVSGASPGGSAGGDLTGTYPNPTIAANAVTFAKFQNIATARLLGRNTAGSGNVEELDASTGRSLLGLGTAALTNTGTSSGNVPVLDGSGKLNSSVLPAVSLTNFYGVVANQAARLALTSSDVQPNDMVKQSDNGITYVLTSSDPSSDGNWTPIGDASIVASDIVSGTIATARLGSGTADSTTYLRGDQTYTALPFVPLPVTNVTGTSQTMAANNGYRANNAGLVTLTLPTTAADGTMIRVTGIGAGGWRVAQNASQQIFFGNTSTTSGNTGRLDSTHRRDSITLECVTANSEWQVISSIGNIDVI